MSPHERFRWAIAPDEQRSTALLWVGIALLLASGGLLMNFEVPPLIGALLYLTVIASWVIGACGAVGYVRWLYRQSAAEAQRRHSRPPKE